MHYKINIKPLSINDNCSTKKQAYFKEIERQLPKSVRMPKGKLAIHFDFYFSNENQDWDSSIKYTQDAIFKTWNMQDAGIYQGTVNKHVVDTGKERIVFNIKRMGSVDMKELLKKSEWLIVFVLGTAFGMYIESIQEVVRSLSIG